LTPAERQQFCTDFANWAMSGPFLTNGCNVDAWLAADLQSVADTAASDADLRATCANVYAQCVANGVTSTCDTTTPIDCTATVAEYDACAAEAIDALDVLPACSAVTRDSVAANLAIVNGLQPGPACTALQAKCPSLTM